MKIGLRHQSRLKPNPQPKNARKQWQNCRPNHIKNMPEIPRSERKTQNRVIVLVPQLARPTDQSKLNHELLL
jgi:hypothetical protein